MEKVNELINKARENNSKRANLKLEQDVMLGLLNDKEFKVGVYKKDEGKVDEISVYETSRELVSSILNNAGHLNKDEAVDLAHKYEFSKQDANNMIDISKEFVNTYLTTGKKINFGSRESVNMSLVMKHHDTSTKTTQVGGLNSGVFETKEVPAHNTVRASGKNLY